KVGAVTGAGLTPGLGSFSAALAAGVDACGFLRSATSASPGVEPGLFSAAPPSADTAPPPLASPPPGPWTRPVAVAPLPGARTVNQGSSGRPVSRTPMATASPSPPSTRSGTLVVGAAPAPARAGGTGGGVVGLVGALFGMGAGSGGRVWTDSLAGSG